VNKNELGMTDQEYEDYIDAMADIYLEEMRIYGRGEPEDDFHAYPKSAA
jgi:hypothetical protein